MKIIFYFSTGTVESNFNTTGFSHTQVYYKDLAPADDSIKLSVGFDVALANKMKLCKNENVKVQIVNDDLTNYFTGYLRKTTSFTKTQRNKDIELELVSPSFLLDVETKADISETECRIETAITRLLAAAGFTQSRAISVDATIPFFYVEAGENVYDTLSTLCKEYGYIPRFDADGYFYLAPIFNQPVNPITQIFDGTNTYSEIKQELKEEEADGVVGSWIEIKYIENTLIFQDAQNGDATYACKIQVEPGKWLFDKEVNYCEYDSTLGEVKFVTSAQADFVHDDQIEIVKFKNLGTKALVSARNNSTSGQYRFTKFEIRGNAYVVSAENTSTVANGQKKNKDVDIKFLFDKQKVTDYLTNLTNYYRYADITITLQSKTNYALGSFVKVSAYGMGDLTGRIIQKKMTMLSPMISYTIEGISEFEAAIITETSSRPSSVPYVSPAQLTNYRTETRFKRAADIPATPSGVNPTGWTITIPDGADIIWMSVASFSYDGTLTTPWTAPTKFSIASTAIGQLSNDSAVVFFNDDGQGSFENIKTTLSIYEAGRDTTATWIIGATPSAGVTGTLNVATYQISGLTTDTGFVDIIANRSGMDQIAKRFVIARAAQGTQDSYNMMASSSVIVCKNDGTASPEAVTISATCTHGTASIDPYAGIYKLFVDDVLFSTSPVTSDYVLSSYDFYPYPSSKKFPGQNIFPSKALDVNGIIRLRVELWDADGQVKLDSQSLTVTKDFNISLQEILKSNVIAENVLSQVPKYLGKYLGTNPTNYYAGDWWLTYGATDTPYQRGVYRVKADMTLERLTGDADESSYFAPAMPDILAVVKAGYGSLENYGQITFIANLATNSLFTQSLVVQNTNLGSTIIDGGKIKTSLLDVDTILGNNATFRGTLDAAGGTFSGSLASGGFELNVSPSATQSFTTNGKTAAVFINEILAMGITQGTYPCTGIYDGKNVVSIDIKKSSPLVLNWSDATSTRNTGNYTIIDSFNSKYEYIKFYWRRNTTSQTYTATFTFADGSVVYASGDTRPSNSWFKYAQETLWTGAQGWAPAEVADPVGRTEYKDYTVTCKNGSVNFTAASFTFKLKNLPPYMTSLPQGTVCTVDDGQDYIHLVIKK